MLRKQAGSIVVSHVNSLPATWISLISLLFIHLATNYRAVRAVEMTSLNRQRANIVFSGIFETEQSIISDLSNQQEQEPRFPTDTKVLRPAEVAQQERIFEKDGILRWTSLAPPKSSNSTTEEIGWCRIGVSIQELFSLSSVSTTCFPKLLDAFSSEAYIVSPTNLTRTTTSLAFRRQKQPVLLIVLKHGCTPIEQLKAWAHALIVAKTISWGRHLPSGSNVNSDEEQVLRMLSYTLKFLNARFDTQYAPQLERAGWDLRTAALETTPGRRINILK